MNLWFRLVIIASAAFLVTVLAMVASAFAPSDSPLAKLLSQYSGRILAIEVALVLITGLLAMWIDRRHTLAQRANLNQNQIDHSRSVDSPKEAG